MRLFIAEGIVSDQWIMVLHWSSRVLDTWKKQIPNVTQKADKEEAKVMEEIKEVEVNADVTYKDIL